MSALCDKIHGCGQSMPDVSKVYLALLAAAAVPATIYIVASGALLSGWGSAYLWLIAFAVGFVHAALFGLPVFLYADKRKLGWWFSLVAGFVIGIMPISLLALGDLSSTDELQRYLQFIWMPGGLGASGGFAAWLVWRYYDNNEPERRNET